MKRRIVPLLSAIITAALFLSCALPADDEIRLISPKDGAILDVDDLSKDTSFFYHTFHVYYIYAIVPLRWESCSDTAIDFYDVSVYGADSNSISGGRYFPADSTLCFRFYVLIDKGRIDEDSSLISDTTVLGPHPSLPQFYDWRVDGCSLTEGDLQRWRIAESEIWSFTVVKD